MASVSSSAAAFAAHLADLEISELQPKFAEFGVKTYGDLGFAVSDPQNNDKVEKELIEPICGDQKK